MTSPGEPDDRDLPYREEQNRRNALIAVAAVLAVVVVGLVVFLLTRDDDGDDVTAGDDTTTVESMTTTTETTTSTEATTSSSTSSTTTTDAGAGEVTDAEAATIAWPDPTAGEAFATPIDVASAFATELVGFTDPLVGEFMAGDSRSGEVEVRAVATGPATTVLVRQMSDQNWYVVAATTPAIEVDDPIAGTAIDHPLQVAGRAMAFEGTVQVAVYARGESDPLGTGFVTGSGGGEMGPFDGEIEWDNPGGGWGLVVLSVASAEDGSMWQATVVPVGFIGGD